MGDIIRPKANGREIVARKGTTNAIYRFIGKDVYIKVNNRAYAANLIMQIKSRGASVEVGRHWMKVNFFSDHKQVKLGSLILDLEVMQEEEIERELASFFHLILIGSGFKCDMREL